MAKDSLLIARATKQEKIELLKMAAAYQRTPSEIIRLALKEFSIQKCSVQLGNDFAGYYPCGKRKPCKEHGV